MADDAEDFLMVHADGDKCEARELAKETFRVEVWPGDYGLASMDVECNKLILYMRLVGARFEVAHPRNPAWRASLPAVRHAGYVSGGYDRCVEDLRFQRYSLDFGQSQRRCSEALAFGELVERVLGPVLEYVFWIDARNYNELTRLWYSRQLPPLVGAWYVHRRRRRALDVVEAQENIGEEDARAMRDYFARHAAECFGMLATRLGAGDYFFDGGPGTLDCLVYAHLAPLAKVPLPADDIPKALKAHANLVEFVRRVDAKYQPEMLDATPRVLPMRRPDDDDDADASLKLKIFSGVFVACAMMGYAFANKIVTFHR